MPRAIRAVPKEAERGMEEIRLLTYMMNEHQDQLARLGVRRYERMLALRKLDVTYRALAENLGLSEQAIYKILAKGEKRDQSDEDALLEG